MNVRFIRRPLSLVLLLLADSLAVIPPKVDAEASEVPAISKPAGSSFETNFTNPPSEFRILKIIHSWPDAASAQDNLISALTNQGFGGVVCNVSFTEYLASETKWSAFERAVRAAKQAGFSMWLYDEKGYPSATAGGATLRGHPEWEARGLLVAKAETEGGQVKVELPPGKPFLVAAFPVVKGEIDLKKKIDLSDRVEKRKVSWEAPAGRWRVLAITEDRLYEGSHASVSLAEHMPYPNLLEAAPTARFLELTHQAYAAHLGNDLGRWFVSTFTDEPSLMSLFLRPMPYRVLPWSENLPVEFAKRRGYRIEEFVAALVTDAGPETRRARYDFWRTVGDLVSENYFGQIERWCRGHQVLSGGHLLMEENLANQVALYGDFFACLRRLDAPGIDCLTSVPEQVPWFIARLAGSAAELEKSSVTMCETSDHSQRYRPPGDQRPVRKVTPAEIRGTCNRLIMNGIGTITSYYSFDGLGEAELRALNEYVGRCCFALKGGHQVADIAVLYPTASVWPCFTPSRHYANDCPLAARIESIVRDVSDGLWAAGRDFAYVDERTLAEAKVKGDTLVQGDLRWRTVILPGADTLPLMAWTNLARFVDTGGVVISVGALPANSETDFPSASVKSLMGPIFGPAAGPHAVTNRAGGGGVFLPAGLAPLVPSVLDAVLGRDLEVEDLPAALHHTHRRIGNTEVFFVINDSDKPWQGTVRAPAEAEVEQWDPATGQGVVKSASQPQTLNLPAYGGVILRSARTRSPERRPLREQVLPSLTLRELPDTKPLVGRGEFVREQLSEAGPPPESSSPAGNSPTPAQANPRWRVTATLTKGQVDTHLFLRFCYPDGLDLRAAQSVVLDTWVPDGQQAPAQLLVMLHQKNGADYLASTGRSLSAAGPDQSWVPINRFQLAGWSTDPGGHLDLSKITEVRVGWGGYYGAEQEKVEFTLSGLRKAVAE